MAVKAVVSPETTTLRGEQNAKDCNRYSNVPLAVWMMVLILQAKQIGHRDLTMPPSQCGEAG